MNEFIRERWTNAEDLILLSMHQAGTSRPGYRPRAWEDVRRYPDTRQQKGVQPLGGRYSDGNELTLRMPPDRSRRRRKFDG